MATQPSPLMMELARRRLTIAQLRTWLWLWATDRTGRRVFIENVASDLEANRTSIQQALRYLRHHRMVYDQTRDQSGRVIRVQADPALWKPHDPAWASSKEEVTDPAA